MCYSYIAQGICAMDKSFYANFYAKLKTDNLLEDHTSSVENCSNLPKNCLNSMETGHLRSLDTNLLENFAGYTLFTIYKLFY